MADNLIPQLEAELEAAQAVLAPQLRGLQDFHGGSLSSDAKATAEDERVDRQRRYDLLQNVLDSLEALLADGYPALPDTIVPASIEAEFQEEAADSAAAAGVFAAAPPPMATKIEVSLGAPAEKPKT